MFPILNILAVVPWRLISAGALASVLFVAGLRIGERRVTERWDAEKAATAQAVAKQAELVTTVTIHQANINQEIANELQTAKAALAADRGHYLARISQRVRFDATGSAGAVSEVPAGAARTDAAPADFVSATAQPTDNTTCEKLAEDAAQTTLMLIEFQHWHDEHAKAFANVD